MSTDASSLEKHGNATAAVVDGDEMELAADALPFVEYRRALSGEAAVYAYFNWDAARFPNVKDYVQVIP